MFFLTFPELVLEHSVHSGNTWLTAKFLFNIYFKGLLMSIIWRFPMTDVELSYSFDISSINSNQMLNMEELGSFI